MADPSTNQVLCSDLQRACNFLTGNIIPNARFAQYLKDDRALMFAMPTPVFVPVDDSYGRYYNRPTGANGDPHIEALNCVRSSPLDPLGLAQVIQAKKERRRLQNRLAAARARLRSRTHVAYLEYCIQKLIEANNALRTQADSLQEELAKASADASQASMDTLPELVCDDQ